MPLDELVEDIGLAGLFGRGIADDEQGRQWMKLYCNLLLCSVTPKMLKVDLTRLAELTHRETKVNDLALHDLMIERETRQQQYYLLQAEMKQNAASRPKELSVVQEKGRSILPYSVNIARALL